MQQGLDAISNSAAARGGSFSGNTLKEIQGFGTGLANQDWWNFVNNFSGNQNRTLQTLFGLSGAGQNAAAGLGGLGANTAATIGNNLTGAGSALAAGQIGVANAANSGLNNLSNILQQLKFQGGDGSFNNNPGNLVASSSQSTGPF